MHKKNFGFTGLLTCQQVATNLLISSSCNKSVKKARLVATSHLQTSYNLTSRQQAVGNRVSTSYSRNQFVDNKSVGLLSSVTQLFSNVYIIKFIPRKFQKIFSSRTITDESPESEEIQFTEISNGSLNTYKFR